MSASISACVNFFGSLWPAGSFGPQGSYTTTVKLIPEPSPALLLLTGLFALLCLQYLTGNVRGQLSDAGWQSGVLQKCAFFREHWPRDRLASARPNRTYGAFKTPIPCTPTLAISLRKE